MHFAMDGTDGYVVEDRRYTRRVKKLGISKSSGPNCSKPTSGALGSIENSQVSLNAVDLVRVLEADLRSQPDRLEKANKFFSQIRYRSESDNGMLVCQKEGSAKLLLANKQYDLALTATVLGIKAYRRLSSEDRLANNCSLGILLTIRAACLLHKKQYKSAARCLKLAVSLK